LSNLVHRDYASVLRDVTEPSAAINPDHVTYQVSLKDGRLLTGTVRTEGDTLLVGDLQGQVTTVAKAAVEEMQPLVHSTMPEGLPQSLGPDRLRDLLTFLLTEPPHMPDYGKAPPPPPRSKAEVRAVLAGAPPTAGPPKPLHVVLVAGPKDHGKGEHDYPAWQAAWKELLAAADGATVDTAWEWPTPEQFAKAGAVAFFQKGDWTPARAAAIDAYLERGGGLVYVHWAVEGRVDAPGFARRIGLASDSKLIKYRHGPLDLAFRPEAAAHPIARNLSALKLVDESYWKLLGDLPPDRVLATAVEDGKPWPLFWTLEPGRGRVFVSIPGH
jgi:putative heme-binding domain-containing protein